MRLRAGPGGVLGVVRLGKPVEDDLRLQFREDEFVEHLLGPVHHGVVRKGIDLRRRRSESFQDLAGEGSYVGKGIYDPRAFHRTLTGRFPEQTLLSHDLIEGAHLKVGYASDIELFDDFPADYITYSNREHRWIRGDWQIADWATPRVPGPEGRRVPNPLSAINRWKILDNLRRSLVPAAALCFMGAGWAVSGTTGATASVLVGVMMLFPPLAGLLTWITTPLSSTTRSWRELGHTLSRSVVLERGEPSFPSANVPDNPGKAWISHYANNDVELQVEADEPCLVVLTDSCYPGWQAFVDGARKPIWRANSVFRAVEVPPGKHLVTFTYRPASVRWGTVITLVTLLLVAAGLLFERYHSKSAAGVNAD